MAPPRSNPHLSETLGEGDTKSTPKAKQARERAEQETTMVDSEAWPRNAAGKPMTKMVMTASELIPTGQYANVVVGPCQITAFVDPDRVLADADEPYFSDPQRDTMAKALNELAEIVEADCVAVQRNLVMESIQEQNSK